jgi:hypothetical protein
MKLGILHVSDLHRDPSNPISNSSLLDSLERDRERYRAETPPIREPNLIIVSGDLVYGVAQDSKDPDRELAEQYQQAEDFLVRLCKSFVGGQRERVIIVPGNHDISLPHSLRSMKRENFNPAHPSAKKILAEWHQRLSAPNSLVRWSWEEMCFLEISDKDIYRARLKAFSDFYERFYGGARKYELAPEQQYHIFDYPDVFLVFAAFNSCCNNDPLNRQGAIHPDCIAEAARELRLAKYSKRIRIAVWHHNTSGPPLRSDYLDSGVLQVLIDSEFSIGFHGHQHKPQFIDEKFQFGSSRKITIVSAGTLCAGPKALPPGHARAYNLLEIDTEMFKARLHLRTMQNENFEQPIWAPGHFPSSMTSFVDFDVQAPLPPSRSASADIGRAEALIRKKSFEEAISLLKPIAASNSLARRLLLECYVSADRTKELVEGFYPPEANNEIIYVADALWAENKRDLLVEMLASNIVRTSTNPAVVEVLQKYQKRLNR